MKAALAFIKRHPLPSIGTVVCFAGAPIAAGFAIFGDKASRHDHLTLTFSLIGFGAIALGLGALADYVNPPPKPIVPQPPKPKRRLGDLPPVNVIPDRAAPEGHFSRN